MPAGETKVTGLLAEKQPRVRWKRSAHRLQFREALSLEWTSSSLVFPTKLAGQSPRKDSDSFEFTTHGSLKKPSRCHIFYFCFDMCLFIQQLLMQP